MKPEFIELDRSFWPIPDDYTFEEEPVFEPFRFFGFTGIKKWVDLFQINRAIILAEAGAGKTEEFRAAAKRLRKDGKKAYFLRLEHVNNDFDSSFEVGDYGEFNHWLAGEERSWIFLDSVDEARLLDPRQFKAAIRIFSAKLGYNKQRAHIYIASRISEWSPQSDLAFVREQLAVAESQKMAAGQQVDEPKFSPGAWSDAGTEICQSQQEPIEPTVFALRPLDHDQIRVFSEASGVLDTEPFLRALQKTEADVFAARPQDLVELINHWKQSGKVGNHRELIESDISRKLREIDPDRDSALPLSIEDAKEGVEMLAAAVTFARKSRILIPDEKLDLKLKAGAIDARDVLPGWDSKEIRALLNRPIFDEAIYGTVRFHHRSIREYLTAAWLRRLLFNGKSRRAIEHLFFKDMYTVHVAVPTLRPILAWLILDDDRLREKAADIVPEVFIEGGDPSVLPMDVRRHMLEKFCEFYANQRRIDLRFDITNIRRFAHSDLGETISRLLQTYSGHEELRDLLLQMIWQGEIQGCSEQALAFALNADYDLDTRRFAFRVVSAAGSMIQKANLISAVVTDRTIRSEKLIAELIACFTPAPLVTQDLLTLIRRVDQGEQHCDIGLHLALKKFCLHKCPKADIVNWIRGLAALLVKPPVVERRYFDVSHQYKWLLPLAALAAERMIRDRDLNTFDESVLLVISLSQQGSAFDISGMKDHRLADLVPKWPELNRALFWFDVGRRRKQLDSKKGERLTSWSKVEVYSCFWKFTEDDFGTILEDIGSKRSMDDCLVALSLAFYVYRTHGRGRTRREQLKNAVYDVPELKKSLDLHLNPPPRSTEHARTRRLMARHKYQEKRRQQERIKNQRNWRDWLKVNTAVLRDTSIAATGAVWNATNYCLHQLRDKQQGHSQWALANWEQLTPEFGLEVAAAFRDGCIAYWRKFIPKIRSEGIHNPNQTSNAVIIGLSGIAMEARQVSNWPANLSVDEAILACRYAVNELNGFPDWLPSLHKVFPDEIETFILAEIEWEFSGYAGDELCYYVLSDLVEYDNWLASKLTSGIVELLNRYEPKHDRTLQNALRIALAGTDLKQAGFVNIARRRVRASSSVRKKAFWLAAWASVNAETALATLSYELNQINPAEERTETAMQFIVALLGGRHEPAERRFHDYHQPEHLVSLIKLMHEYIRSSDDIHRLGEGVYTPKLRDHAQSARDRLFDLLRDTPGKASYLALKDLAQHHPDETKREWCAIQAKRRAEADAEAEPWPPGDIAEFAKQADRAPQNYQELFDLAVSRLRDLRAELEDGDTSIAEILRPVQDETKYRNWIGDWLRKHSLQRYVVPQEEELADAKKVDIRVHGFGFNGCVAIELKVADKWSGAELVEGLNNQLPGYLRDQYSNCGIFLLVYLGERKYWRHRRANKNLDFSRLIQFLKEQVKIIVAESSKIEGIEIVGIDLTKRSAFDTFN